ncbi:hypothetical protein BKD30_03390 [Tersicoccus phoenicis]|uniref:Uncharacterized protein n=1 Tax=Tersicoccus phoenicis TaxID=554083 RepID=A0A1R1LJI6_9MICC|nr:hypothetical protein [Tersicoccus phoenicis]OMH27697.1 hypothetical protein BKD30_03390 [Tersicoccus phoenicis]
MSGVTGGSAGPAMGPGDGPAAGPSGERLMAAALVEDLVDRVRYLLTDVADQRVELARAGCTAWQSTAAQGYRDALLSLAGALANAETETQGFGVHLVRLAEDLRYGRTGDLVDAQTRVVDAVLRAYATPGAWP